MTDRDDHADPLLVRPYLRGGPGGPAAPSGQTWPGTTAEPSGPAPAALPPPAMLVTASRAPRRVPPTLVVVAAALALALAGVAVLVSWWPESRAPARMPTDIALPSPVVSEPPGATGPPPVAEPPAPETTEIETTGARGANGAEPGGPQRPGTTRTGARTTPGDTLAPPTSPALRTPPSGDRIGPIRSDGGLCLDLPGALIVDDSLIQTFTCNDTVTQRWTLAADGTLRVAGRCAVTAADTSVRTAACDGRKAAQWRIGPDRTVVNLADGGCLTDPAGGDLPGTPVRVDDCTGSDGQHWSLP